MSDDKRVRYATFGLLYLAQGAILMAVANVGTGIGLAVSGSLVDAIGYRWTFVVIAALNLLALPLITPIFRRRIAAPAVVR